jgi:hypothetical protein
MSRNRSERLVAAATLVGLAAVTAGAANPVVRYRPLTPGQLDKVTAPVALYPDLLLAQVLPAAAHPLDVALADQWLRSHPTPTDAEIAAQPWDASVRSLVHYPPAFKLLADHLDWARQLGLAYANQPTDVTKSIQRLRVKARIVGTLNNTPEQTVVVENHYIEIQPTEPEVIYVPVYDPATCFVHPRPPRFEHPTPPAPPADPAPSPEAPAPASFDAVRATRPPQTIYTESGDGIQRAYTPSAPSPAAPVTPLPAPVPQSPAAPAAPASPQPAAPAPEGLALPATPPAARQSTDAAPSSSSAPQDRHRATVDR